MIGKYFLPYWLFGRLEHRRLLWAGNWLMPRVCCLNLELFLPWPNFIPQIREAAIRVGRSSFDGVQLQIFLLLWRHCYLSCLRTILMLRSGAAFAQRSFSISPHLRDRQILNLKSLLGTGCWHDTCDLSAELHKILRLDRIFALLENFIQLIRSEGFLILHTLCLIAKILIGREFVAHLVPRLQIMCRWFADHRATVRLQSRLKVGHGFELAEW